MSWPPIQYTFTFIDSRLLTVDEVEMQTSSTSSLTFSGSDLTYYISQVLPVILPTEVNVQEMED